MKILVILIFLLFPVIIFAYQPKPVSFWFNSEGEAFGELADGSSFSQVNLSIDSSVKLQRFTWSDGSWYVSSKGIIYAYSDLQAFSIYLSL